MNGTPIKFEIARGALHLLGEMSFTEIWKTQGITQEEYDVCRGAAPWLAEQRQSMRRVLDAFAVGTMDLTGTPRFELPAEYLAAVVATYVHPNNMMAACRVFETTRSAQELAGATVDAGMVDPAQLFALVCAIHDSEACEAIRHSFEKKAAQAAIIDPPSSTKEVRK